MIDEMQPPPRAVIIDVTAQDQLDLTSVDVLERLVKELQGKGILVAMADVHTPVREFSRKMGLLDVIGEERFSRRWKLPSSLLNRPWRNKATNG